MTEIIKTSKLIQELEDTLNKADKPIPRHGRRYYYFRSFKPDEIKEAHILEGFIRTILAYNVMLVHRKNEVRMTIARGAQKRQWHGVEA